MGVIDLLLCTAEEPEEELRKMWPVKQKLEVVVAVVVVVVVVVVDL